MASYILVESVGSAGTRRRSVHTWNAWSYFIRRTTLSRLRVQNTWPRIDVSPSRRRQYFLLKSVRRFIPLSNLLSPAKPKDTSLADIMQRLKNHYNSSRTTSYKFNLTTGFRILVERLRGFEGDNWNEVFSLNGTLRNEELDCILNKHADLFKEWI